MKNISDAKKIEILEAYNDYVSRVFEEEPYNNFEDIIDDGSLIGIAYTEYEKDDEYHDYDSIQISYNVDSECYEIYLNYGYKENECMLDPASIDDFIENMKYSDSFDFLQTYYYGISKDEAKETINELKNEVIGYADAETHYAFYGDMTYETALTCLWADGWGYPNDVVDYINEIDELENLIDYKNWNDKGAEENTTSNKPNYVIVELYEDSDTFTGENTIRFASSIESARESMIACLKNVLHEQECELWESNKIDDILSDMNYAQCGGSLNIDSVDVRFWIDDLNAGFVIEDVEKTSAWYWNVEVIPEYV